MSEKKTFYIDFNSFSVEAKDREEARKIALTMIQENGNDYLNDFEVNEE